MYLYNIGVFLLILGIRKNVYDNLIYLLDIFDRCIEIFNLFYLYLYLVMKINGK